MIWFKLPGDNRTIYKIENHEIITYDVEFKRLIYVPINGERHITQFLTNSLKGEPLSEIDLLLYGLEND